MKTLKDRDMLFRLGWDWAGINIMKVINTFVKIVWIRRNYPLTSTSENE